MEIIADILEEALKPRNRTRLMYQTNLSFFQANRYFERLLEKGLIIRVNGSKSEITYYRTTEKGENLLKILDRAQEFLTI
jgi:predicted transcriptional regulator